MVATGFPSDNGEKTEIVDLINSNITCELLHDISYRIKSVSGLLENYPVICGGSGGSMHDFLDECVVFDDKSRAGSCAND